MILRSFMKFIVLLPLFLSAELSFANSCKSLLEVPATKVDRVRQLTQEFKTIEVLAAVALSLKLQPDRYAVNVFGMVKDARKPTYPSIDRLDYNDAQNFGMDTYNFSRIEATDRNLILQRLPDMMRELLFTSKAGVNFQSRFNEDGALEILERRSEQIPDYLRDNLDAIILNAVKMPTLPARVKLKTFFLNNVKLLVFASLPAGVVAEQFFPGLGALAIDYVANNNPIGIQEVLPDIIQNSYEWSDTRNTATTIGALHTAGTAVKGMVSALFFRGSSADSRFHTLNYDFSYAKSNRSLEVEILIAKEFPEK